MLGAIIIQFFEPCRIDHGAGGIGRAGNNQAVERFAALRQQVCRRLKIGVRADGDFNHLDPERCQNVAIRRIAGRRHRDLVAFVERGNEAENERAA